MSSANSLPPIYVESIGVAAPGLLGWPATRDVLRGQAAYVASELPRFELSLLPPNECRRAPKSVKLAFRVAEEALSASDLPANRMASVFSSSESDTHILDRICAALTRETRVVSPTDFHNSVHNAPSGYWHIATQSRAPSMSMAVWDAVFACGLLEATAQVQCEALDCLLVAYDLQPPTLIAAHRPIDVDSGVAMVLSARRTERSLASLQIGLVETQEESRMSDSVLENLRLSGTAMRSLPILQSIALGQSSSVVLAGAGAGAIQIDIAPC